MNPIREFRFFSPLYGYDVVRLSIHDKRGAEHWCVVPLAVPPESPLAKLSYEKRKRIAKEALTAHVEEIEETNSPNSGEIYPFGLVVRPSKEARAT